MAGNNIDSVGREILETEHHSNKVLLPIRLSFVIPLLILVRKMRTTAYNAKSILLSLCGLERKVYILFDKLLYRS